MSPSESTWFDPRSPTTPASSNRNSSLTQTFLRNESLDSSQPSSPPPPASSTGVTFSPAQTPPPQTQPHLQSNAPPPPRVDTVHLDPSTSPGGVRQTWFRFGSLDSLVSPMTLAATPGGTTRRGSYFAHTGAQRPRLESVVESGASDKSPSSDSMAAAAAVAAPTSTDTAGLNQTTAGGVVVPEVGTQAAGEDVRGMKLPRVEISYCTRCKWLLRAAYYAQELLSTFETDLGEVTLQPATGGYFAVHLTRAVDDVGLQSAATMVRGGGDDGTERDGLVETAGLVERVCLWDRKVEGGFPDTKVLKQKVRDVIDPERGLGHVDRHAKGQIYKEGQGDGVASLE